MPSDVELIDFTWHGIAITVSISHNFLNTGYHHIELRGDQPLPVTTTGYRSHFIPMDQFEAFASLEHLVRRAGRSISARPAIDTGLGFSVRDFQQVGNIHRHEEYANLI